MRFNSDILFAYCVFSDVYHATKQGEAVLSSGLPPDMCAGIIEDLTRAREGLVLESDLHLTYICVPSTEDIYIDWSRYMKVIESLSRIETGIMQRVGVKQGVIQANARGYGTHSSIERRSKGFRNDPHRVYHRFWIALILSDLVQEVRCPHISCLNPWDRLTHIACTCVNIAAVLSTN